MKLLRRIKVFFVVIFICLGVNGCMNSQENEEKIELMKRYAEDKYGEEFSIEYFQEAKDITYINILTLSNEKFIFNVYQDDEDKNISDDYLQEIIDKKFEAYLKNNLSLNVQNMECFVRVMLTADYEYTKEQLLDISMEELLEEGALTKIILVIRTKRDIVEEKENVFEVYKCITELSPKYIDFEVIKADNVSPELEKMLMNIRGLYDNDWSRFSEITSHLTVTDQEIISADKLVEGVKE